MKHIFTTTILVVTLAALSACSTTSFAEKRAGICPMCTDAEWQVKVQENAAKEAKRQQRYNVLRQKRYAEANQRARDEQAFYNKYPRCYNTYEIERGFMGVTSPQFLALCDEWLKDNQ